MDRKALWRWLEKIAATRRHGVAGKRPGEVFEAEERSALKPLPEQPYEVVIWKRATLHRDAHVQVDSAFYSAPWKLIGQRLDVKVVGHRISIYREGEHLWTHAWVATTSNQNGTSTDHTWAGSAWR